MMRYRSAAAMWSAVRDTARATGDSKTALREFIYDRFLARLFTAGTESPWVLKGGNALLSRSPHLARATTDIDLGGRADASDITTIQDAFTRAISLDLDDHFRFTITKTQPRPSTPSQPRVAGVTLTIQAWCGTRQANTFRVDLVAGSLITDQPESITRTPALTLDGYPATTVVVYPVVDHIADKICATAQLYTGQPSSRARDLVDLVVIATTQRFSSHPLRNAVTLEWAHRQLPGSPSFEPPTSWSTTYTRLASQTPACRAHPEFFQAVELVQGRLLHPIWAHTHSQDWSPEDLTWAAPVEPNGHNRGS